MELVQGQSLANLIHQRGRLAPNETLKIVATAAEALDVAHRAHIIHRDIKPANLLVNEDGAVKIVDFGIASAKGQAGLTETGTVMGTLSYASPEQLAGHELSGATDLYSLGIVAYECLAGRPPFPGNDPAAVITAHMTGQPAPLPPDVPQPVAQIVMRCLAKDPRQRFGSAAELAQACRTGRPGPGTTAILAPPSPQPTAPVTQAMGQGPGATQPMTQAMGRPSDPAMTQAMDRNDFSSPPRGRDLPPPRDFEEPKRSKAVPLAVTAAGVLVLVIALVLLIPWGGEDEQPDANEGTEGPAVTDAAETEGDSSPEADDEAAEEDTDRDEESSDDDEAPSGGETTETTQEAPTSGQVPQVVGSPVVDAIGSLQNAGFGDIDPDPQEPEEGETPEQGFCVVTAQDPSGGDHSYEETIRLEFWDDGTGCGA